MTRNSAMDALADGRIEEAAMWWAKFQECEPAAEDVAAWLVWMEADELNAQAFHRITELALRLRHTRAVAPAGLQHPPTHAVLPVGAVCLSALFRKLVVAAAILLIVTMGWMSRGLLAPDAAGHRADPMLQTYATQRAGQQETVLADGSRAVLGGASLIVTDFSSKRRLVRLSAGEAYFEVSHDAQRPFVVDVGIASVRALGTAFNIRRNEGRVAVTVTQGRVKVERADGMLARLAAASGIGIGQSVEVGRDQQVIVEPERPALVAVAADPERATAWRRGRLEFVDEPLDIVIDNVSRYSSKRLVAADPHLHAITYTGSFVPEHFESWLSALQAVFPVDIVRQDEVTEVRTRREPR